MADQAEFLRQEYLGRINRVMDYIDSHLDRAFRLEELADVACFSRFHFHRIFSYKVDGEVGLMTIPGGKFAVGHFEIDETQFGQAWDALLGEWMPSSGYQSDGRMCYELYLNDPHAHSEKKFLVDICEPVKPL